MGRDYRREARQQVQLSSHSTVVRRRIAYSELLLLRGKAIAIWSIFYVSAHFVEGSDVVKFDLENLLS